MSLMSATIRSSANCQNVQPKKKAPSKSTAVIGPQNITKTKNSSIRYISKSPTRIYITLQAIIPHETSLKHSFTLRYTSIATLPNNDSREARKPHPTWSKITKHVTIRKRIIFKAARDSFRFNDQPLLQAILKSEAGLLSWQYAVKDITSYTSLSSLIAFDVPTNTTNAIKSRSKKRIQLKATEQPSRQ